MRASIGCFLVCCIINLQLQAQKFYSVKGKEIITPNGKPFLMKGTNLGNWLVPEGYMFKLSNVNSPRLINESLMELIGPAETKNFWKKFLDQYITEKDIVYLKSLGMNSIRVPFNYRLFTTEDFLADNNAQRGFYYIDRLLQWCRKANLPIILDMHCAPGGQTGDNIDDGYGYPYLFDNEADQQLTINIWAKIASHYKNEPMIIGYDLLNEPIAHYFDTAHFNPRLEPLYKRITAAIRKVDNNHLIFLGGAQWDSNFKPFGPPFDSKLVYQFHKYWTAPTKAVVQDYIDFGNKYNVPIYVGETGENTDQWVDSFRVMLEQNNIGWHFWPYKKMENTKGIVQFSKPAYYDSIIAYAETPKQNFADIRKGRLKDTAAVKQALENLLSNCSYSHCQPNEGYIKALGLNFKKIE